MSDGRTAEVFDIVAAELQSERRFDWVVPEEEVEVLLLVQELGTGERAIVSIKPSLSS